MKNYTKEIYKIQTRSGHHESSKEMIVSYMNVLQFHFRDELSMLKLCLVGNAYRYQLMTEEKLRRKQGNHMTKVDKGEQVVSDKILVLNVVKMDTEILNVLV